MAMTMLVVLTGLIGLGIVGAGLIALHHLLGRKDKQMTMDTIKKDVIPELESMTMRMLDKSFDMIPDKCVDMTKKMLKAQKEFEDEEY